MSIDVQTITDEARARAPFSVAGTNAVLALTLGLSTIFTAARLYTRFSIHQRFWWDDCKLNFATDPKAILSDRS